MSTIRFPLQNRVGQVYEPFKTRFLERTIQALDPDEVLVKVRASAICGSDLHIARGCIPPPPCLSPSAMSSPETWPPWAAACPMWRRARG